MTVTRIMQTGFELQDLLKEITSVSNVAVALSTVQKKTGNYSIVCTAGSAPKNFTIVIPATAQARSGFHFRNATPNSGDSCEIISLYSGTSTQGLRIRYNGTNFLLIAGASTQIASGTHIPFATPGQWFHISIDAKIHASAGWFRLYVDGVQIINYSGQTNQGIATMDRMIYGTITSAQDWDANVYYDDIVIDDMTSEVAVTMTPDVRFDIILVNGNGVTNDWVGSDADSTNNYLLVDEIPNDGDTTYVSAAVAAVKDLYDMNTITLPAGWSIAAVIPFAYAKKDNAGTPLGIRLLTRLSATEQQSAIKALGTDYTYVWDRQTAKPGGGAWLQADLNAVQVGILTE